MRRAVILGVLAAAACAAQGGAWASVATAITVSDFAVRLATLEPGVTAAVSFVGGDGTTSTSNSASGDPAAVQHRFAASGRVFGAVATATAGDPHAGSAASLSGNAFSGGALIATSAWARSDVAQSSADGTIGLVDGVSTASFTLAPWTVMTISAHVFATASSTGASDFEVADSGFLMAIGDESGTGLQFAYFNVNAFAFGGLGAVDDTETAFLSLRYENASDTAIRGVFSGYVGSSAYSGLPVGVVPEPAAAALWLAGLLAVGARLAWRGRAPRKCKRPASAGL